MTERQNVHEPHQNRRPRSRPRRQCELVGRPGAADGDTADHDRRVRRDKRRQPPLPRFAFRVEPRRQTGGRDHVLRDPGISGADQMAFCRQVRPIVRRGRHRRDVAGRGQQLRHHGGVDDVQMPRQIRPAHQQHQPVVLGDDGPQGVPLHRRRRRRPVRSRHRLGDDGPAERRHRHGGRHGRHRRVPRVLHPVGREPPANLAALTGITATPSGAWATGQWVTTNDLLAAHWSGSAWVLGKA